LYTKLKELRCTNFTTYNLDLKYFQLSEFDSPDDVGSGKKMNKKFLEQLDYARHNAGIPFKINSGYRTEARNTLVGGRWGSSHKKGLAVDIAYTGSRERYLILSALMEDKNALRQELGEYFVLNVGKTWDNAYRPTAKEGFFDTGSKYKKEEDYNEFLTDEDNFLTDEEKTNFIENYEREYLTPEGDETPGGDAAPPLGSETGDAYQPSLNDTQYHTLSPLGVTGRGAILENGSAITMQGVPTGAPWPAPKTTSVTGMRVDGTKVIIDTALNISKSFGQFKKSGNKYKWVPNPDFVKPFKQRATKQQQASFNEFIRLVESDPKYAAALLGHTQGGRGTMNAATLEIS